MAVKTRVSAVTATAAVVFDNGIQQNGYPMAKVIVRNMGPNTCYLGPADVATTTGFPVGADEVMTVAPVGKGDVFYAVCAAAETATLRFLYLEQ
jgi:hypothetical protein